MGKRASLWRSFIKPSNWLFLFGAALLRLLILLPLSWQRGLGASLGVLYSVVQPRRRHIVDTNLRLCFPDQDLKQRLQLRRAHFRALGIGMLETALAWWDKEERIKRLVDVEGLEHLQQAQTSGRGIMLLTAHATCMELGCRFITQWLPFHAMYRPHNDALVDHFMIQNRERRARRFVIPRDDIRTLIRELRKGEAVWYAPDQNYGRASIFVPFFDIPAYTVTTTARLVERSNALVLPYYAMRQDDGRYRLIFEPVLEHFPSADIEADTVRINQLIEHWIKMAPAQYYWVHRRFKTRPPGEEKIY